jgi:hypothetical protein
MDNVVVRSVAAPSEAEARTTAVPILEAFRGAGWELRESLWIPGDRRPSLGETLLLSPESQLLLEGEGTLRLSFSNADAFAVAPAAEAATRVPDTFEEIGGVRYRRLVPRWGLSIVIGVIGLFIILSMVSGAGLGPLAARPTPDNGICPVGWVPGMKSNEAGTGIVPDGTCDRFP